MLLRKVNTPQSKHSKISSINNLPPKFNNSGKMVAKFIITIKKDFLNKIENHQNH